MAKCLTREIDANGMVFGPGSPARKALPVNRSFSCMVPGDFHHVGGPHGTPGGGGIPLLRPRPAGYSPGARPGTVEDYQYRKLVSDVTALADALGYARFHLIGHDWGSAVGWALIHLHPGRVRSWTAMSVPHMDRLRFGHRR